MRYRDRKGGKLEPAWSGPYAVKEVMSKRLYKLQNKQGTELKTAANSATLKIYHEPATSAPVEKTNHNSHMIQQILNHSMLDDNVINEAQRILRKQFGHVKGWQDTVLSQKYFLQINEESVQIHHTGHEHWVCSTSIGGFVRLYDSMGSELLTSSLEVQLAECYQSLAQDSKLEVELPPAQLQNGGVNCGLFCNCLCL